MFRLLAFFAVVQLAVGSNVFLYKNDDSVLAIMHRRHNFRATLTDSAGNMDFLISPEGQVLSCTVRKLEGDYQKFLGATGTIDGLIKFLIDRGVEADNLVILTNLRNLKLACFEAQPRRRMRRSAGRQQSTMFIYPGTKWCGKGNIARDRNDIGENFAADSCCRDHDSCQGSIISRTSKFNYYNDSPFTINSCRCDEEFKTCLQSAATPTANNVGELFFNQVGMRCYRLRYRRRCAVKRSFWNTCSHYRNVLEAYPVQLPRWVASQNEADDY